MHTSSHTLERHVPQLFLDHGADEAPAKSIQLHENGAIFQSPWRFHQMGELRICLSCVDPRLGRCRFAVCGVVVLSRKVAARCYETTVLFPDLRAAQKQVVRKLARFLC